MWGKRPFSPFIPSSIVRRLFAYDASGQRVKAVEPAGKTTYFPFPNYEETVVGSSTIKRSSYALAGQVVGFRVAGDPVTANSGLFFIYGDHLGSTTMLGTSGGAFVAGSWARYRPYGSYRTTPTQTLTDRDFTGQRENRELGLIYYQARFYHPSIGRFISPDTIVPDPVNPQQLNRYTYSLNSPIRFSDPTGHVCYDPNTDAATSGNCNGGSKPKVTPRSHKGSDNTISPGFELSNDDLLLLTLGVFAENQNASHPPQAMTLWTWMFLSKQALNPENSMYEIINFASGAWNDPNFVNPYKKVLGVPPTDGAGHRAWLLQAANGYMNSSSNNAKNFQALYTQIAGEDAQAIDGGIYDEWRANGTNSTADPTHGSVFAVHRAASRFENELGPLFVDYAQSNPAFSYVFSPPYLGIMTVTGNDTCVYDHTLCE